MAALDRLNELFKILLQNFRGGVSNTSTVKYDNIKTFFAKELNLEVGDVYITGANKRVSNLDTRLAQGNQRNQHSPLAVAFLTIPSPTSETKANALDKVRTSFASTCTKFVDGVERGTTFDGIAGFAQFDDETVVHPLSFIHTESCPYQSLFRGAFPSIPDKVVRRAPAPLVPLPHPIGATMSTPKSVDASNILRECELAIKSSGLRLQDGILTRFLASLMTKRFVILAGLSGSGKTKLALAVAKWFEEVDGQIQVVAVGADWTDNESVLGYRDALDPGKYRSPTSGALDLILTASRDSTRPYFLIMDEMNLSHVERYFADILSAIESNEPVALHSADSDVEGVPSRLLLPNNLFIVGTVNVDETTYMFSPKVLDRANVIEFAVSAAEMETFLEQSSELQLQLLSGNGSSFAGEFLALCHTTTDELLVIVESTANGATVSVLVKDIFLRLFEILSPAGAEFGYRTAAEMKRFIYAHARLIGHGWEPIAAIDAQIIQKLMPKIHGSERRLRPVLQQLHEFCQSWKFTMSEQKCTRMLDRLRDGFVSFLD